MSTISMEMQTEQVNRFKSHKSMMYVAIVPIVMLFGGFTSLYIIQQTKGTNWVEIQMPPAFINSTIFIVLSSLALFGTLRFAKQDKTTLVSVGLLATLSLGIGFLMSQLNAWEQVHAQGIYFVDNSVDTPNASGSFFYLLTGFHLFHILGGLIAFTIMAVLSFLKRYHSGRTTGLEVVSIYWHFLGVLWIYLLLFLVYIR